MSELTSLTLKKNGDVDVPMGVISKPAGSILLRATGTWDFNVQRWTAAIRNVFAKTRSTGFDQFTVDIQQPICDVLGNVVGMNTATLRFGISVKSSSTQRVDILKAVDAAIANTTIRAAVIDGDVVF